MFLAVLHLAFDGALAKRRRDAMFLRGWGVQHLHPTGAALSSLREFPPDVAVIEAEARPDEVHPVLEVLAQEPHRRGGHFPLVIVGSVSPRFAGCRDPRTGPWEVLPPGASDDEVQAACLRVVTLRREALT
ncbi:MAG: hypothetical protein VKO21_04215 [Candidatus Sericytochromatia bacterium]|nr:hypothetical protein [Candidatus Sericytochromatia bacterium]